MDNFPSLFELSSNVVAECFRIGIPPTNHVAVSPRVQEEIFETVMRMRDYCYNGHTKELIQMFQPKKLHLDFGGIQEETFDEIQKLMHTELKIRKFERISKYIETRTEQERINAPFGHKFCIERFLDNILSSQTKEGLRVLDICGSRLFGQHWMEGLSLMFSNLENLNVCGRNMCVTDFTSLCSNFRYLRTLDISKTGVKNLNGLAKLQILECLSIHTLLFETKEDIKDLFELKQLKKLTFGVCLDNWNYDWFFEKSHQKLETLVCRWHGADDAFLQRIIPKLPRLQTVVAYETRITRAAALPGVSVYVGRSIEDMMKTIGYFRSQNDWKGVEWAFDHFNKPWIHWADFEVDIAPEKMTLMVNELEAVIHVFKLGNHCLPDEVRRFLGYLTNFPLGNQIHPNIQNLNVLSMYAKDLKHHLKKGTPPSDHAFITLVAGLDKLTKTTEDFNVDKICSLAMKSIIHGSGFSHFEYKCADTLDTLMDQMDLTSKYYKTINFRLLYGSLRLIQNNTNLLLEQRTSAGNVLRFVELFM